ncbi:tyrosine-protein phosphatase [Nocardia sp. NPDC052316]|uniref:tyrosine-protein phosphatase n=1 Tax=Nocardia sp. NPDC052316 TaxID=3364329 RepID=UPI0037C85C45
MRTAVPRRLVEQAARPGLGSLPRTGHHDRDRPALPLGDSRERSGPAARSLAYHNLSIEHRPYDQAALGPEIEVGPYLAERFLEVAEDGVEELRRAVEVLAAADGPAVFHCASGKDRTGLLAALVLNLLGVPDPQIIEDFTRTELATDRLIADWRAAYPGKELTWPGYGRAPAEVMRLFLAALAAEHGSVRRYTTERLGIDDDAIAALRRNLLEAA